MSDETPTKRKYELKKRADEMAETRRRITEAAVELHGTVGPARTTLSAVAERAGVQRHTVYRHFPSDAELFAACSTHYNTANPWPDVGSWRAISDPRQRLRRALDELYAYYERTEPMFSNILRDAESSTPSVRTRFTPALPGRGGRDPGRRLAHRQPQTACPCRRAAPCHRLPDLALARSEQSHRPSRGSRVVATLVEAAGAPRRRAAV